MFILRIWMFLLFLCFSRFNSVTNDVWILDVRGPIGVATMEYVVSSIDLAHSDNSPIQPTLIILKLDTPGGLENAMRGIIKRILSSNIPIVGYVHPQGARAASAGTYILYATHIAAMSPATNLGAATPVQIGLPVISSEPDDQINKSDNNNTMTRKIVNDATAYIEGLADLRGRNREWAAEAVLSGASKSAKDALEANIINIIAYDIDDLLTQLNGYAVVINGQQSTLNLNDINIVNISANWRQKFLSVVGNPSFAFILILIGIYGLIFEFSNPGGGVLGLVGAVCILTALYGFQVLPINHAGLALILLGIGLMIAEVYSPSFGIFSIIGAVSLIIGSVILIDTPEPAFQIALPIILSVAISSIGFVFLTFGMLFKSRQQKKVSGIESLLGETAEIESVNKDITLARLQGELWQVQANEPLILGDKVTVSSINGLTLNVLKQLEH
jgi:membrane-bound serine protease (ClpP class)